MMEVNLNYSLLKLSLVEGEVFNDINLWWKKACIVDITHLT